VRGARTSIRSGLDHSALAAAASRPGIDPRVWVSLAVVVDVGFDPDHGVFVDVQYQPSGDQDTALLGAPYAGDGFGSYWPPRKGDTVVVVIPGGDPGHGPVVVARVWNAGDPPPAELAGKVTPEEPSPDVLELLEKGVARTLRTRDADTSVEASGTGLVRLQAGDQALPRGDDLAAALDALADAAGVFATAVGVATPAVAAAATKFNAAVTQFKSAKSTYLSVKAKVA
jgi:hypothetical protein